MTQPAEPTTPPTGATPPAPAPTDPTPPAQPADDKPLGPAGQKALAAEREARQALEKQVAALAPLAKFAEAIGVDPAAKGKSDLEALAERVNAGEQRAAAAELRALRLEVAAVKGFSPEQAAELKGSSREELEAHADRLRSLFPVAPGAPAPTGTPAPDHSQGSRGNANELQALLAQAQKDGNVRESIRLKTLINQQRK